MDAVQRDGEDGGTACVERGPVAATGFGGGRSGGWVGWGGAGGGKEFEDGGVRKVS